MNEMHKFVEFYLIKLWLIYLFFSKESELEGVQTQMQVRMFILDLEYLFCFQLFYGGFW
jgi:hypothetical protein